MKIEDIEAWCSVDAVLAQEPSGATDDSKEFFEENRRRIGEPVAVLLAYVKEPTWDFFTYVVGSLGRSLRMNSFSWGYGGQGPRGLRWLFEQLGWTVDPAALPAAHEEGLWEVRADGSVTYHDLL